MMLRRSLSTTAAKSLEIRFPSVPAAENLLHVWTWNKAEGDLLNPGDVLLSATASNARYSFTLPDTFRSAYLGRILVPDFEREVSNSTALGFTSLQRPSTSKRLATELLRMKPPAAAAVQQQEDAMVIFDDLLKEKDGKKLSRLLKCIDQGNRFRLFAAIATDSNVKQLLAQYRNEDLFCLWDSLNAAGHHPALRDAMFKELSSRQVSTLSPYLISRLVDLYPNMDAFFGMLIAADAKAPAEQRMDLVLVEGETFEHQQQPLKSVSTTTPNNTNIEASKVPSLGPRKLLAPQLPIKLVLDSPEQQSAPAAKPLFVVSPNQPPVPVANTTTTPPQTTTRTSKSKTDDYEAVLRGTAHLYSWLLQRGGSFSMHKMGEFYATFPDTGAAVQKYGVGNLREWFEVEKSARGYSLKIRSNSKPPPGMRPSRGKEVKSGTPKAVVNDLVEFLEGRGGWCQTGEIQTFYDQNPQAKDVIGGNFKKFIQKHTSKIAIDDSKVVLVSN